MTSDGEPTARSAPDRPEAGSDASRIHKILIATRVLIVIGAIFGIAALITSLFIANTGGQDDITVTGNPAIEELIPPRRAEVLVQSEVGIDLVAGYQAELVINGTPIPESELGTATAVNRFTFTPGQGKVIERLQPEENCVIATYWPALEGRQAAKTISWCFQAA